ncbi:MAG: hypothetical protein AB7I30_20855 [Isosphaeraceae bacterium]
MASGHTPAKVVRTSVGGSMTPTHLTFVTILNDANPDLGQVLIGGVVRPPSDLTHVYPIVETLSGDVVHTYPTATDANGFPGLANVKAVLFKCRLGEPISDTNGASGEVTITISNGSRTDPVDFEIVIPLGDKDEVDGI